MKVLFFHLPALGQYNAIEPVLLELARRGHAVIHFNESAFERYLHAVRSAFRGYARYGGYQPRSCRERYEHLQARADAGGNGRGDHGIRRRGLRAGNP